MHVNNYIKDDLSYEERLSQYWKYLPPNKSPVLSIVDSFKSNHFYWRIYQMFQELISFTITILAALFPKYLIYIIPVWHFISFCIIFCCKPYLYVKNTVVDCLNEIVQFGCSFLPILNWYKISISENILFVIGIIVILTIAIIPTVMFIIDIFQDKEDGSEEEDMSESAESNDEKFINGNERKIEKAKKNYKYGYIPSPGFNLEDMMKVILYFFFRIYTSFRLVFWINYSYIWQRIHKSLSF
jgi:hypothetical protein